jgi:hypothetical protein
MDHLTYDDLLLNLQINSEFIVTIGRFLTATLCAVLTMPVHGSVWMNVTKRRQNIEQRHRYDPNP